MICWHQIKKAIISLIFALLIERIIDFYSSAKVIFDTCVDDYNIPYDKAATISLLVNEIISNSIKHAFKGEKPPCIRIHCIAGENDLTILEADDGEGFPQNILNKEECDNSMGMELIQTITKGLGGKITFYNDGGAVIKIIIPNKNIYVVHYSE